MSKNANDRISPALGAGNDAQGPTDAELVLAVRAGDRAGFDELVCRYQRQATAIAYRLLSNRDDAMEVAQDAFLKAYDRLDMLKDPSRFGPWLLRILSNLALNRRRSRALRKMAPLELSRDGEDEIGFSRLDPRATTPLEEATANDLRTLVAEAIQTLPEAQRQTLILFSMYNVPQKEIAEAMECTVETVKWNVFSARKKLKELLGKAVE